MKLTLNILTGKHKGKSMTLPGEVVVVGRDPEADIRVNSTEVSRLHCELHIRGERVIVKDLGSRNGTFINGEAIFSEAELHPGDTLHVGAMVFELPGKKKTPSGEPRPKKPPAARVATKAASDEDVIDWLAEGGGEFEDTDTTIVTNAEAKKMEQDENSPLTPRTQTISIQPIDPGSHAAQAAQIIRDFWSPQ
jgi:predicted component of type VI protein secretion system